MESIDITGELQEKRRQALLAYAIGQVRENNVKKYRFLTTAEDVLALEHNDPLESYAVQSSWVAEATSCKQQYIRAAYHKLEPGFETVEFDKKDLDAWKYFGDYSTWAAVKMIQTYPENVVHPAVRIGKTSLFKTFENDLNQERLTPDSVQTALQAYLEEFVKICDLDVVSAYMHGKTPDLAVYYFISRTRGDPRKYFWRQAEVEVGGTEKALNPAAWSEPLPVDIPVDIQLLDIRPVLWNGRLCIVWATWRDRIEEKGEENGEEKVMVVPDKLDVYVAFKRQNDQWSPPTSLLSRTYIDKTLTAGIRLIATVWSDYQNPKGKLGVLLTNDKTDAGAINETCLRDVFLHDVPHDDGAWLEHVAKRFSRQEMVQHPLMNQPQVVATDSTVDVLSDFLGLHATAYHVNGNDVLIVQGFCWLTGLSEGNTTLTLKLLNPNVGDAGPIIGDYPLAGGWNTISQVFTRNSGSWTLPVFFTFDRGDVEIKRFKVMVKDLTDFAVPTLHKNTLNAAQFLSFNQDNLELKFTRLNTLIGPDLVQLASVSPDAVLDWLTQHLKEPAPYPSSVPFDEPNGAFDSAYGRNFWELFFHAVHLVATRLRNEERFQEALDWLKRLFDPQAPADPPDTPVEFPRPLYWRCRPLISDGNPGHEAWNPLDPDAICYGAPRHYRILVFCEYVQTLLAEGDWYYRQLTRDSLVAARLCYVQAQFLMGKEPSIRAVNRWQPTRLDALVNANRSEPRLEAFEKDLAFSFGDFPLATDADARSFLVGSETFRSPINDQLLRLYALPGERLDNLRNNRNIDGTPMLIELFSPPADPKQLLRDLAAGNSGAPRAMGGRMKVTPVRWSVLFDVASRAVDKFSELSNLILRCLESRDQTELQEISQQQMVEMGEYSRKIQEQTLEQLDLQVTALVKSKAVAQERFDAYSQLYTEDISTIEYDVMDKIQLSKQLSLIASSIKPVGAAIAAAPNIFGMANGGHRVDKITDAVVFGLNIAASVKQMEADKQAITEAYRRRRNDWGLQRDQAAAEVCALDAQINAQKQSVLAARTSLEQALRANAHTLTTYNFLKQRATNAELYGWLLSQLKALHYQARDAVVSLCSNVQASLSAETGDYDSLRPLPQVWQDNRHGLSTVEHMRVWLLHTESDYMQRRQRRPELCKTISLRQLFSDPIESQPGNLTWAQALIRLKTKGTLDFCLTQLMFDRDHPGHYCRQISKLLVILPVVKGPFEDVRATLTQISSKIATKPSGQSVRHLHNPANSVAPSDVLMNLLAGQSIVISTGLYDNGLAAQKPDEGLLDPFENTGAVSCWQLKFPWPQKEPQCSTLGSLQDIILELRFCARSGDPTFVRQVEDMVTLAEKPATDENRTGAGGHA